MATRLQKFDGRNNFNNYVHIDFMKRDITFRPVKGKTTDMSNYGGTAKSMQSLLGAVIVYACFLFLFIRLSVGYVNPEEIITFLLGSIVIYTLSYYIFIGLLFFPPISKRYPKINAALIDIRSIISRGRRAITKGHVNKALIRGREFRIPDVENVYFEYKVTGDFARYLKDIEIVNQFEDNPYVWDIVFRWSKHPIKGSIYVEYI